MGKSHWKPIHPPKPPAPVDPGNHPPAKPGVPLIWWIDNAEGRTDKNAGKANIGIATLIVQRDDGTLWRVSEDKPPYTWIQIAHSPAPEVGDPYHTVDSVSENITEIGPWMRVINAEGKTFTLAQMYVGDSFEIVDDERVFNGSPVTLVPAQGMKFAILDTPGDSLTLDTVGQGATWRFFVVASDIVVANVP